VNASATPLRFHPHAHARSPLERRLRANFDGDVLFDAFSRGRYSTDASIYQIEPVGIAVPRTEEAARVALQIAAEEGVPILPRGAGTSQCGQTVGAALVIDCSKYLNQVIRIDADKREATVQPGLVLDHLNARLIGQALVSGRRIDFCAGHHRRHDRQQLLRLALDPLRQHGAQRTRRGCLAHRWR
jgi:hypothetical protein